MPYHEVIGIPAEIALQIADHLKAFITGEEKKKIEKMPTDNMAAYELMQEAIYLFNGDFWEHNDQISSFAQEAIDIDPNYADAHAMLGLITLLRGSFYGDDEMNSVFWEGAAYLNKAIALDAHNVRAITGLAAIDHFTQWDYIQAEEGYSKAFNNKQGEWILNGWYILFLLQMDRPEDAIELMQLVNWELEYYGPKIFILAGDDQKAIDILNGMREFGTVFLLTEVSETYLWLGDNHSAIELAESAIETDPHGLLSPRFKSNLATAYYKTGDVRRANTILDEIIHGSHFSSTGSPEFFIGAYYSWIGEVDSAFFWLEKACKNRSPEMPWIKADPAFNSLKEDTRYWDLYARTGHKAYDEYMASRNN